MNQNELRIVRGLRTLNECKTAIDNATSRNRPDFAQAVADRGLEIRFENLRDEFNAASPAELAAMDKLARYEATLYERHGKNVPANRLRQAIGTHGILQAVSNSVSRGHTSVGFGVLEEEGQLANSFEAVVIAHPGEFEPDVVARAKARLASA